MYGGYLLGRLAYVGGVTYWQACICCGCFLLGRLAYVIGVHFLTRQACICCGGSY